MKNFILLPLWIAGFSLANGQTTIEIPASKDNTMYSENGTTSNGAGSYLFAGATNGGFSRRALVSFDLSAIPANAQIISATLTLFCSRAASGQGNLTVHKITRNWGEANSNANANEGGGATAQAGDATWTHPIFENQTKWTSDGGDFIGQPSATIASVSNGATINISTNELKSDVISWLANPSGNFGWMLIGREGESASARRYNSRQNASNQPKLSIIYETALPVQLISFAANRAKQGVQLDWLIAREENFSHFNVEYSENGLAFQSIESVPHHAAPAYSFIHLAAPSGRSFYRLAMVDKNGTTKYSSVATVSAVNTHKITIWPNPAVDVINLKDIDRTRQPVYRILDMDGRMILTQRLLSQQINISRLKGGKYYLEISFGDGTSMTESFIKID